MATLVGFARELGCAEVQWQTPDWNPLPRRERLRRQRMSSLRSIQNRLTWVLMRREQTWRIVHEHTSAPIGIEDLNAIARR